MVNATSPKAKVTKLRLTISSLSEDSCSAEHGVSYVGVNSPSVGSTVLSISVGVVLFVLWEQFWRWVLFRSQGIHPMLEDPTNRHIFARHLGVDMTGCTIVATLGVIHRSLLQDFYNSAIYKQNTLSRATADARVLRYHPAGHQIAQIFTTYQVKNTIDSIIWDDGPEFIIHHVLALVTSWGAMHPGTGHVYVIFFMGISEVSTAVLCLLSNFDEQYGVGELGEVLPLAKLVIGLTFVALFIICRTILWPYFAYHFAQDGRTCLQSNLPALKKRRTWMWIFLVTLTGLSLLQILFLGQLVIIAREEISAFLK